MKNKTIAYTRKSKDVQDLENQIHRIKSYAHDNKFQIDKWYEIELSSRKSEADRQIDKLIDTLNNGDTLIVTEFNRLGRKMLDLLSLVKVLNEKGVKMIFTNDELLNPSGNEALDSFKFALVGFLAEDERNRVSDRTKRALKQLKDKGVELGHNKDFLKSKYDDYEEAIYQYRETAKLSYDKICNLIDVRKDLGFKAQSMRTWFIKRYEVGDIMGMSTYQKNKKYIKHLEGLENV